ncbi:ribosomal-protein-serine acetyltransferase [Janthinobacterium sp. 61]|uniref:GNAT family N-acetyltransferase n=1 Tax=Janthinobacterium sp. 61 TaxID=2035209 RepID=UPI000CBDA137|nr:GNAT family protein [Janthinobacterium sp. 61]PKV44582.1 ribosomal-protein-serine acetyltransferase [Janthinobacterium sp. 61]
MNLSAFPDISIVPTLAQHAEALAELVGHNREHLHAFLPAVVHLACVDDAREYLCAAAARAASGDILERHIFSGTALCGSIRLKETDTADRKASIGYYVGRQFQGRGIASAAVRAVLAHAFGVLQLNRIALQCAAGNHASMALAGRLGFAHEGVLRQAEWLNGVFVDLHVYALLQADFRAD